MVAFIGIVGLCLLLTVAGDAFEVMLLPRRVRRRLRFVEFLFQGSWAAWVWIARRFTAGRTRDAFLSVFGPLSMVLLLSCWASGLIVGFGLLHWALEALLGAPTSLLHHLYLSGSTFFTLGYGDVLPGTKVGRGLAVFEAGVGLAFIAVTIGYLPVLYQLFSRRESQVILLDARAGSPPTGVALLCRHCEQEALPELGEFLKEWEQWCAELTESHLSYPMLSYYRSQHDNQSWLAALATVLDCCALILTGLKGVRTFQARMTFAMARLSVVELCQIFRLRVKSASATRVSGYDFQLLRDILSEAGLFFSDEESAESRLAALRATYDTFITALSTHLLLPLGQWNLSPGRDNWQKSSRGGDAKELVESTPAEPK